ncbi:NAD(P)H-dependent oxidoreductase [Ruminococcaceae bacterium OttesenSCG-928-L11]|nr:NAD(P)H-dependent oxidoreductase [Ruminococcaceae bacterium OttesenSCG-928-L11]
MDQISIGVLVGSERKNGYSLQMARAVSAMMPEPFRMHPISLGQLAMFNQNYDDEGAVPPEWEELRQTVARMDGFLFVTPEYNRSVTPLLKNALDIASRPYGQNRWSEKPCALISLSPGSMGGFGASRHLLQCLSFLNLYVLPQPEMYIGNVAALFDSAGEIANPDTKAFLEGFAARFSDWVKRFAK